MAENIVVHVQLDTAGYDKAAAGLTAKSKQVAEALQRDAKKGMAAFGALGSSGTAAAAQLALAAGTVQPALDGVVRLVENGKDSLRDFARWLFGAGSGLAEAADGAEAYTKALKSTGSAARRTKKDLAGFDKLDVLMGRSSGGSGGGVLEGAGEGVREAGILEKLLEHLRAKAAALAAYFTKYFAPSIAAWGDAFNRVKDTVVQVLDVMRTALDGLWTGSLKPLEQYLLYDFIPSIVNAFSETFAPIFADVLGFALEEFGRDFAFVCGMVSAVVRDILLPALDMVKGIALDILESVRGMWETYGAGILDGLARMKEGVRETLQSLYDNVILPVMEGIGAALQTLWDGHLKPLWDKLLAFIAELVLGLLEFWNEVLQPFIGWLVETFGPMFAAVFSSLADSFSSILGAMADMLGGLLDALRGVLDFLLGIFLGDWQRAWEGAGKIVEGVWNGIAGFVKGIVNAIIGMVNGLVGGIVAGINAAVGAMNTLSFTVPDWVPVLGGRAWGFSLSTITAPQIPYLAQGAVIPPNREFLAVLGDQKSGTNIETPESLLRQVVREEAAGAGGDIAIRFTGSLSQLARVLKPEIERENTRVGTALVSANR